jgi:hypothetical protein
MADTLSGEVKVPGVGGVPKKEAIIGLVVVGTLIVVYYVRKRESASATTTAAAAATSTDQYPPDGTVGNPADPYSTDPATGQTYGDESVGSGTYGAYSTYTGDLGSAVTDTYPWDGTVGNEADPYSEDPATGITYGDEGLATGGTNASPNGGPPFANNSDWSNWVIQQETSINSQTDTSTLEDALGLYLNGQPVDTSQQQMIFDAIALAGDPPVAGPNGYPPSVQLNGNTGGSGSVSTTTSSGGSTTTTTPSGPQQVNVVGQTLAFGLPALESAGWTINSVTVGGKDYAQAGYPSSLNQSKITSTVFHAGPGMAGQYFANSVDVVA